MRPFCSLAVVLDFFGLHVVPMGLSSNPSFADWLQSRLAPVPLHARCLRRCASTWTRSIPMPESKYTDAGTRGIKDTEQVLLVEASLYKPRYWNSQQRRVTGEHDIKADHSSDHLSSFSEGYSTETTLILRECIVVENDLIHSIWRPFS